MHSGWVRVLSLIEKGLYQPGHSLFHLLDPRIKILSSLILISLIFSASNWPQIIIFLGLTLAGLVLIPRHLGLILLVCSKLRWLFLFTILMHLFLSPGRTLFGTSWLSLDGLIFGFFVCLQMALTVLVACILGITTSTIDLAAAFGWAVRPLNTFGFKTEEWQKTLLLSLSLIPIVHEEIYRTSNDQQGPKEPTGNHMGRWVRWHNRIKSFIDRLVTHADRLALDNAENNESDTSTVQLRSLFPMAFHDIGFVLALLVIICFQWILN